MERVVKIVLVRGKALASGFVDLPYRLYQGDPLWVPPLRSDVHKLISAKTNPFFAEADIENFVAMDGAGTVVGRVSATIHHAYNDRFGPEHAFFGLFESENDPVIASALLAAVEEWATARGKDVITGPYSYTSTQDAALLIENIDGKPPTLLQTYNPPYYRDLLEACSYGLAFTFSTYGGVVAAIAETERVRSKAARVRARNKITARAATREELAGNLEEIRRLFNDSFSSNREVASLSAPVFKFAIDSVRPFIDLEGIRVIEVDGKPSAFFLILPDLNEVLRKLDGSFGLLDLIKLSSYKRSVRKAVVALIGSDTDSNGKGLGRIIAEEMHNYIVGRYDELHTMWIDDRNPSSYVLAQNSGLPRTKRYGVFRKQLAGAGAQHANPSSPRTSEKTAMNEPIIRITGLNKHYQGGDDQTPVLRNIHLAIPSGSMTVIRGMSGSGKTTLLNIIGGLDSVDAGQVEVAGIALEKLSFKELTRYRAEKAGFIFQFHNLIPTLTVLENVLSGLEAMRPLRAGDEEQARYYLNAVGLAGMENKFPARLSGGQQQRVAIARALIKEPTLILADEPTGSLDEESGQDVIDLLRRLQAEKNVTVVIVTHNPEWGQYADTVYEMRSGSLHVLSGNAMQAT